MKCHRIFSEKNKNYINSRSSAELTLRVECLKNTEGLIDGQQNSFYQETTLHKPYWAFISTSNAISTRIITDVTEIS